MSFECLLSTEQFTCAATHGDSCPGKLMAHGCPGNAQLVTDLAQGTTLGVQVGCTLNVHCPTVTSLSRIGFSPKYLRCQVAGAGVLSLGALRNHSHISGDS